MGKNDLKMLFIFACQLNQKSTMECMDTWYEIIGYKLTHGMKKARESAHMARDMWMKCDVDM